MSENTTRSELSRRLRALPGRLLLALINATAILVIVAGIMVIAAFNRVESAAANVAGSMTESVLGAIGSRGAGAIENLQQLNAEIAELSNILATRHEDRSAERQARLEALHTDIIALRASIDRINAASRQLGDQAIRQMGVSITEGIVGLRRCTVPSA